jgi:hypothetical protein
MELETRGGGHRGHIQLVRTRMRSFIRKDGMEDNIKMYTK